MDLAHCVAWERVDYLDPTRVFEPRQSGVQCRPDVGITEWRPFADEHGHHLLAEVGVTESAVIGVPDPDFGEQVVAVLVCEGTPLGAADIRPALDTALARFKHPRRIEVIDALPRNAMGKVQKGVLRERYASADAG